MKITKDMINKDVRFVGVFIRKVFKFRKKSQFVNCNKLLNRFMKGRYPKDMRVEERFIPSANSDKMRILVCYPKLVKPGATGVLWIHGGGYALGIPEQELGYAKKIVDNTNSVVVLPDYTRSVDKPFPAALEDCYAALLWLKNNSQKLGVNKSKLFVAGESAGGGLTAALSLYARDKKEVNIAFQMPLYPMLDCRMASRSMQENDAPVWDARANELAWKLYLANLYGSSDIPCYASPSLAENYSGLPPTYTFVGNIEPFYDETIEYINNLNRAGVTAKVDVYEGCFHAFDLFGRNKAIGKTAIKKWIEEFKYATENYCLAQKED